MRVTFLGKQQEAETRSGFNEASQRQSRMTLSHPESWQQWYNKIKLNKTEKNTTKIKPKHKQWNLHSWKRKANFSELAWCDIIAILISKLLESLSNYQHMVVSHIPIFGSKHFLSQLNLFLHQGTLILWEALETVTNTRTTGSEFAFISLNQAAVQRLRLVFNWGSWDRFLTA